MEQKSQKVIEQRVHKELREVEKLWQAVILLKEEAQQKGFEFSCLNKELLAKKIRSRSVPFIYHQMWSSARPGSLTFYKVGITNPGFAKKNLCVSIFFGVSNFLDDIGIGLCGRDTLWPLLSSDVFELKNSEYTIIRFDYVAPIDVPLTTYHGNSVLWQGNWRDKGVYFDRGSFDVKLYPYTPL